MVNILSWLWRGIAVVLIILATSGLRRGIDVGHSYFIIDAHAMFWTWELLALLPYWSIHT
jgi:hypothetical protein